ncbi:MAG: hypothetical protein ACU85V_10770 [Gammaproteobacteria bacterium]
MASVDKPRLLPFTAHTATGDRFDVAFPLHADTGSARTVGLLLERLLETLSDAVEDADVSNGDVLQALAMTLAIRAGMIHAAPELTGRIARELLEQALEAISEARHSKPTSGHA